MDKYSSQRKMLKKKTIKGLYHLGQDPTFLGKGSYGLVYIGSNLKTKDQVAIKVIDGKENKLSASDFKKIKSRQEKILKKLKGKPNILQYFEVEQDENILYIVTELCDRKTLADEIHNKSITELRAYFLFDQILKGMLTLFSEEIIHCDLKPNNIFVKDFDVKIADFNLSRSTDQSKKNVGNPTYRAPEIPNRGLCLKSDIWSLGLILYQILVGQKIHFLNWEEEINMKKIKTKISEQNWPRHLEKTWLLFLHNMIVQDVNERMDTQQLSNLWKKQEYQFKMKLNSKHQNSAQMHKTSQIQSPEFSNESRKPLTKKESKRSQISDGGKTLMKEGIKERSHQYRKRLSDWVSFQNLKHKCTMKFYKNFEKCEYKITKRIFDHILVFLAAKMILSQTYDIIKQFQNDRVEITGFSFDHQKWDPEEEKQYMAEKKQKIAILHRITEKQQMCLKQFNLSLREHLQNKEKIKIVESFKGLRNVIEGNVEKQIKKDRQKLHYYQLYNHVANHRSVYLNQQLLNQVSKKYEISYLLTYLYIRIMANFYDVFDDSHYQNCDKISRELKRYEQCVNPSSDESQMEEKKRILLSAIRLYNRNYIDLIL